MVMQAFFKSLLTLALVMVLFTSSPILAAVKAMLSQSTIFEGGRVTLTIQSDQNNVEPDLAPLQKNFKVKVTGSNSHSQINIMTGDSRNKRVWTIELLPKSVGKLEIPEITVGHEKTHALSMTVTNLPPEVAAETSKHIFIESSVELDNNETYVQQQIPYTVKLYYDSTMQTGEIFSPKIENANIRPLGNDKKYQIVRAGKKYSVYEKRYVVSPEKSGSLHIPPTEVRGRIALSGGDSPALRRRMDETDMLNQFFSGQNRGSFFNSPFDEFFGRRSLGPSRPFSVSSEPIDVNVLSVPASFKGQDWLPAEDLIMTDSWAEAPPQLNVGEPVTRKLILQAKGLASSQIPDIHIPKPTGMKVYSDQAKSETPNDGNTIYGIKQIDISYIPNKEGKVIIPKISVDWWDVNNKLQKTFTLPEWNLSVAAGVVDSVSAINSSVDSMADVNPNNTNNVEDQVDDIGVAPKYLGWKVLAALVICLGVLIVVFSSFKKRAQRKLERGGIEPVQLVDVKALTEALVDACASNDKHMAARTLLKLIQTQWNDPTIQNLGILSESLDEGGPVVKQLEKSLYSKGFNDWNGSELYKLQEKGFYRKAVVLPKNRNGLEPLYPV